MANHVGGKIGDRIAAITTRARLAALDRAVPLTVKHAMAMQEEFFALTGREVRDTIGPLYRQLAEAPDMPEHMRDTFNFLANGKGQWATLLAGGATSGIIGLGVGALLKNWVEPAIGALMRDSPNMPLSIADAAAANIRGLSWGPDLWTDAGQAGLDQDRFRVLQALGSGVLSPDQIMELLNRELIDAGTAVKLFKRIGMDHDHSDYLFRLRQSLMSVQEAAAMANRDIITVDELHAIARHNGYTNEEADQYNLLGGAPPDLQTLILAWRRGVITESDVDRGIIEGPLRKEWIPTVKELQWQPLPVEEAANAVNQGHMDLVVAQKKAEESGVRPEDFAIIIDNAGIPPGPQEALSWVNRGSITEDEFRAIFLESRLKNKYIDQFLNNRHELLTFAEIRSLASKGAIPHDAAVARLVQRGYTPEDAGFILAGASSDKTTTARDMTVAQVVKLFQARLITEDVARSLITAAGYDDQETTWWIDLANIQRLTHFLDSAIGRIHTLYIGRHLDDGGASAALDQLNVAPDGRDDLLAVWQIERGASSKELTTADVISATKLTVYTSGQAWDKLVGQGYHGDDAIVKLKVAKILEPEQTQEDLVWPNR